MGKKKVMILLACTLPHIIISRATPHRNKQVRKCLKYGIVTV